MELILWTLVTCLFIRKRKLSLKREEFDIHKTKTECRRSKRYKISARSSPGTLYNVWNSSIDIEIYMELHELESFIYQLCQHILYFFRN